MTGRTLAERVTALEQYIRKDTRLVQGVERLADETGGLNQILTKVDEQQQRLSTLGRDLERVEKSKVSKEDLLQETLRQQQEGLEFRKAALKRIYASAVSIVVVLGLVGGFVYAYEESRGQASYDVCVARNEQNLAIVEILRGTVQANPDGPAVGPLSEGIQRLEELIIDCEDLK